MAGQRGMNRLQKRMLELYDVTTSSGSEREQQHVSALKSVEEVRENHAVFWLTVTQT